MTTLRLSAVAGLILALASSPSGASAQVVPLQGASAQTPEQDAPPAAETLTVDEIVARLGARPAQWGMFAFRGGVAAGAQEEVEPGGIVLALPLHHGRTGYLRDDVRLVNTDRIVAAHGTPVFERTTIAAAFRSQRRAWCAVVNEGASRSRQTCFLPTPNARAASRICARGSQGRCLEIARADSASPYEPLAFSTDAAEAAPPLVAEDPAAADAFPPMELVYSFKSWSGRGARLERGLRIEGRIVGTTDFTQARERDGSVLLRHVGGSVRLQPSENRRGAIVSMIETSLPESDLRRGAGAILRLPPGDGFALSLPDSSRDQATPRLDAALFLARPTAADFARYYPVRASQHWVGGRVVLLCVVGPYGRLFCFAQSETPPGWGFEAAAIGIASGFRFVERFPDGRATVGSALRIPITFRLR